MRTRVRKRTPGVASCPFPVVGLLCAAVGCGGGSDAPIPAASYAPDAAVKAAFEEYDRNKDGTIEGAELDACPAIKSALAGIDANKDGKVSPDELRARFGAYQAANAGAAAAACTVKLNGSPLAGAEVTLTPDPCRGGRIKGGRGTTDANGVAAIRGDGGAPGVPSGLYRVAVSKKDAAGAETVAEKYNAKTTLGQELYAGRTGRSSFTLNLSSR